MWSHGHRAPRFTAALCKCPLTVKHINPVENYTAVRVNRPQVYTAIRWVSLTKDYIPYESIYIRYRHCKKLGEWSPLGKWSPLVAGRGPKGSQGQVVLCVWIWVQVTKTCSICANSPKRTLRICMFFWSTVANLQTQTMVWGEGAHRITMIFLMHAGIIQQRQPTDCEDARGCETHPCPRA